MFSLIITIISIALVAALAIATIYFGGSSFLTGGVKATATTLVNQGAQIAAAGTLAVSQGKGWPAGDGPIFEGAQYGTYLSSMPAPPASAYFAGLPAPVAADWKYYETSPGVKTHHFMLERKITTKVCLEVNKQNGFIGIPFTWDGTSLIQCFGDSEPYTFLFDPPGVTPAERLAVVSSTVALNDPGGLPGQKRKCPDGTIQLTLCPSSSAGAGGGTGGAGAVVTSVVTDGQTIVITGTNLPTDGTATIANLPATLDIDASTPTRVVVHPIDSFAVPATIVIKSADLATSASGTVSSVPHAAVGIFAPDNTTTFCGSDCGNALNIYGSYTTASAVKAIMSSNSEPFVVTFNGVSYPLIPHYSIASSAAQRSAGYEFVVYAYNNGGFFIVSYLADTGSLAPYTLSVSVGDKILLSSTVTLDAALPGCYANGVGGRYGLHFTDSVRITPWTDTTTCALVD